MKQTKLDRINFFINDTMEILEGLKLIGEEDSKEYKELLKMYNIVYSAYEAIEDMYYKDMEKEEYSVYYGYSEYSKSYIEKHTRNYEPLDGVNITLADYIQVFYIDALGLF